MKATSTLGLLEDVRSSFDTLHAAFEHVAEKCGCKVGAVKMAYYRSRPKLGGGHGLLKLRPAEETVLVGVAQAFSVNNLAHSKDQLRELVQRKWGRSVSRS